MESPAPQPQPEETYAEQTQETYAAQEPIYFVIAAFLIALATSTAAGAWPRRMPALPVPFTGLMFVWGALVGLLNASGATVSHMHGGIEAWTNMDPDLIFSVFLPILVFGSALSMQWHRLKRLWTDVALLAIVGTLYNAALITVVARWVLPYSWSWSQAALFGAITSAIDPIAVVALIKSVGASATLGTVIEGESLLNDGVAYVLFELFRRWQAGEELTAGRVVSFTCQAALGGAGLGLAFGVGCTAWLLLLFEEPVAETWVLLVTSLSCFLVSDQVLDTSGILALTFCGLLLSARGMSHVSAGAKQHVDFFWEWAEWTANTLIFFLSGAIIAAETYEASPSVLRPVDWAWSVLLWLLLIAIRASVALLFFPVLSRVGYGLTARDAVMLTWAGLRGSVGLVLAFSVLNSPELGPLQYRTLVFFHMAFQSGVTLLVQGTTTAPLLRLLGFLQLQPTQEDAMRHAAAAVEECGKPAQGVDLHPELNKKLLIAPDWGKAERLSSVEVLGVVERRASSHGGRRRTARGGCRHRWVRWVCRWQRLLHGAPQAEEQEPAGEGKSRGSGGGMPPNTASLDHYAQLRDVRRRLLGAMRCAVSSMHSARVVSGGTLVLLEEAAESALDGVAEGLLVWEKLRARLRWVPRLEKLDRWLAQAPCCTWLRCCTSLAAKHAAQTEAAAVDAFIHAHRYARAQLSAFETVEEDLEAGSGSGGPDHMAAGGQPGQQQQLPLSTAHPYQQLAGVEEPSILADVLDRIHRSQLEQGRMMPTAHAVAEQQGPEGPKGCAADPAPDEALSCAIRAGLRQVMEESRGSEAEACRHLDSLQQRYPAAARKVSTVQAALVLLERKRRLLAELLSAGVLEQREVARVQELAARRLKHISLHYHWQ